MQLEQQQQQQLKPAGQAAARQLAVQDVRAVAESTARPVQSRIGCRRLQGVSAATEPHGETFLRDINRNCKQHWRQQQAKLRVTE